MSVPPLSRRDWLRLTAAGALGPSLSGWLPALAADAAAHPHRRRSCILLWMDGGPSHKDTFDLKPGTANAGTFKPIDTSVPGIRIGETFTRIAKMADKFAFIRSVVGARGGHDAYQCTTGWPQQTPRPTSSVRVT